MAHTGCLNCFISTVNDRSKKKKAIKTALVAGTHQTLSNLFRDFQYICFNQTRVLVAGTKQKQTLGGPDCPQSLLALFVPATSACFSEGFCNSH
jgi:hypothetical protein